MQHRMGSSNRRKWLRAIVLIAPIGICGAVLGGALLNRARNSQSVSGSNHRPDVQRSGTSEEHPASTIISELRRDFDPENRSRSPGIAQMSHERLEKLRAMGAGALIQSRPVILDAKEPLEMRQEILKLLIDMGLADLDALLLDVLRTEDLEATIRIQSLYELARRHTPGLVEVAEQVYRSESSGPFRYQIVAALGLSGERSALPLLAYALTNDPAVDARCHAATALGMQADDKTAIGALIRSARQDRSELVRERSIRALGRSREMGVLQTLAEITADENESQINRTLARAMAERISIKSSKSVGRKYDR